MTDSHTALLKAAHSYTPLAWSDLSALREMKIATAQEVLTNRFPQGSLVPGKDHAISTRLMTEEAVALCNDMLSSWEPGARIQLKITKQPNSPSEIRGLYVYRGGKTVKVQAESNAGAVELGARAFFVAHNKGAAELILAVVVTAERAIQELKGTTE